MADTPRTKKRTVSYLSPDMEVDTNIKALRKENKNNKRIDTLQQNNDKCINDLNELKQKISTINIQLLPKTSQPKQKPNVKTNKNDKNDKNNEVNKIRIIVKNSQIKDPINNLKNHLDNKIKIYSIKESSMNKEVIILEINISQTNDITNLSNWNDIDKGTNIIVDKYHKNITSMCLNKISTGEDSILELPTATKELQTKTTDIFNIRYNRNDKANLILFETYKKHVNILEKDKLNIPELNLKFNIREFDPIDNYIQKCHQCNKFGHYKSECKEKEQKCGRCNSPRDTCKFSCAKASFKCTNCGEAHSSNYKGCSVYKKEVEKATENKKKKDQTQQIKKIENKLTTIKKFAPEMEKTYAATLETQSAMIDIATKIDQIENQLTANRIEIINLKNEQKKYVSITQLYKILYETMYMAQFEILDNQDELKHGIMATVRDNLKVHKAEITKALLEVEEESVLFEKQPSYSDNDG